jgi:hypothetical protein
VLHHGGEEGDGAADVDAVVCKWDFARLADSLERSEVDDIVDIWVLCEDLVERGFVGDVGLVEGWSLAADELDAIDNFRR